MRKVWLRSFISGLTLTVAACSQTPQEVRDAEVGTVPSENVGNSEVHSTVLTDQASGAVFISGERWLGENAEEESYIRRYAQDGELVWERVYETDFEAELYGPVLDLKGNLIVTYGSESAAEVFALSASGQELWRHRIQPPVSDSAAYALAPQLGRAGNIYVSAVDDYANNDDGTKLKFLAKIDSSGRQLWAQPFDPYDFHVGSDGSIYVLEDKLEDVDGIVLTKYDSQLKSLWRKKIASGTYSIADIDEAADGLYLSGSKEYLANGEIIEKATRLSVS